MAACSARVGTGIKIAKHFRNFRILTETCTIHQILEDHTLTAEIQVQTLTETLEDHKHRNRPESKIKFYWSFSAMAASLKTCLGKTYPCEKPKTGKKEYNPTPFKFIVLKSKFISPAYYSPVHK